MMKFITSRLACGAWAELATIANVPASPVNRPVRASIQYLRT